MLESLKGGVERALVDVEAALRQLLDSQADPPAVYGLERQSLEHEEVDAASKRIGFLGVARRHEASSLEVERSIGGAPLEVKRNSLRKPRCDDARMESTPATSDRSSAMMLTILLGVALQTGDSSQAVRIRDSVAREIGRRASERARHQSESAVRRPVTSELLASAFKNGAAKDLLEHARTARMTQDSALSAYDVNAYQRISAGIGFSRLGRDRLAFRTETSGRVRWQRDAGMWVDITGARTVLPGIPDIGERETRKALAQASGDMLPVPYFPGYEPLWTGPESARREVQEEGPIHPLAEGAEAYYTYSVGDSLTMTLPDHRVIRLRSLDVRPREAKWNLMVGSLWFEESGQLVKAAYRFAVPMHIDAFVREQDPTAFDDVPSWVKPLIFPMHGEVSAVTIEYGMYDGRFWLPRARAAEGTGTASFMRVPFKIEQTFKYNSVNGLDSVPRG